MRRCRELGKVSQEEHAIKVLVTRQDLTSEDRLWAQNYEPGDVLRYTQEQQDHRCGRQRISSRPCHG